MTTARAAGTVTRAPRQRLFVVTGKGGVGKTLVATALAAAFASRGERTLLVRQADRDVAHALLPISLRYTPTEVRRSLFASRLDGHSALKEYVHRTMWLPGFYDWFLDGPALAHFTEAAPGFEELMCLGKLYDLATTRSADRFERIVFDAPASGHAALMLRVPRVTTAAVRTGPLHHNAVKIQGMLENDLQTVVLIVTLAEEMAVREAVELAHRLRSEDRLHIGPVIVNRLLPTRLADREVTALAGIPRRTTVLDHLTEAAAARRDVVHAQRLKLDALRAKESRTVLLDEVILPAFDADALIQRIGDGLAPLIDGTMHV